jgi:hypothetical protein
MIGHHNQAIGGPVTGLIHKVGIGGIDLFEVPNVKAWYGHGT